MCTREGERDDEEKGKNIPFDLIMKPLTYALLKEEETQREKIETHFVILANVLLDEKY